MNTNLSEQEILFCELYINGNAPYAGNAAKCYEEAFQCSSIKTKHLAKTLLAREDIQQLISKLKEISDRDAEDIKRYLTENLIHIIDEASTAQYVDRFGQLLSPAPLRSVAVSAAKALMEMYPVRKAQVNKLNIESNGEGSITFNVIVPETKSDLSKES